MTAKDQGAGRAAQDDWASDYATIEQICAETTREYLDEVRGTDVELEVMRTELLRRTEARVHLQNLARPKGWARLAAPSTLKPSEVAAVLIDRRRLVRVSLTGKSHEDEFDLLTLYSDDPADPTWGTYFDSEDAVGRLILRLAPHMPGTAVKDTLRILRAVAPFVPVCSAPNLVAVGNGVVDTETMTLAPHSPDTVFLTKIPWDWDPAAPSPSYTMPEDGQPWTFDWQIEQMHDDPEVQQVLWEILSAAVRNNVRWDKAAFFYSPFGSNGKGTIAAVVRSLLGEDNCASIQLTEFADRFALGLLTRARAIVTDENDVGSYSERSSKFKAVVTGDKFTIERKHKDPGDIVFRGMVIECINDFPRAKDKSDSFARRQLFVPFDKRFEGVERKYIKSDYIRRPEVMRYVLRRCLEMKHTELSEPAACKALKETYRRENDSVREFWGEFADEFVWDLLPTPFLFDLYKAWFAQVNPGGGRISQTAFTQSLRQVLEGDTVWDFSDPLRKTRTSTRMSRPEHLIATYDLERWMNPVYRVKGGGDPDKLCLPATADRYRGVVRRAPGLAAVGGQTDDDSATEEA